MNKNYTLMEKRTIDELHGEVSLLKHNRTGAQILLIDNHNHNKTFAIGFKTPPEDSTGVAHIVEHSTLSGSRKYKTKEPFMDMVASSVQTFLNAMTYPDKTLYPISSRNEKDFCQLMDVYLDAVFYPAMKENPRIFYQEGWHPEIQHESLVANGVVFNEMKGVYSDPNNRISDMIRERLHPTGTYSHDSGGNPKNIPDLTYDAFLAFHARYYHPSNSYILLAGDLDFDERLNYLDEEYLSRFDYADPASDIVGHPFFDEPKEFHDSYNLSEEEDPAGKNYFAFSLCAKENPTPEDLLLRSFFQELFVESENGLLKKPLQDAGIGEDVYSELSASNTWDFTLVAYRADEDRYEDFKAIVTDTLNRLADEGMDEDLLEATLEKFEFTVRRGGGSHADLISYIGALNTWLYGQSPLDGLEVLPLLNEMREKIGTDYYQEKIREFFLKPTHRLFMNVAPEKGKQKREDEALATKQKADLAALSDEEKKEIEALVKDLRDYQMAPDSAEAKATIPKLDLEDLADGITDIPRDVAEKDGVTLTKNPLNTNGIVYTNLAFHMGHLTEEELAYASLLGEVLTKVATKNYDEAALETEIFLSGGGFTFDTPVEETKAGYAPYFFIATGALPRQIERGYAVLDEILHESRLNDVNRLKTILEGLKADIANTLLQSGHSIVSNRVRTHFSEGAYVDDRMNGLAFFDFVCDRVDEKNYAAVGEKLQAVAKKLFAKDRLTLNLIAEKEDLKDAEEALSPLIQSFDVIGAEEYSPAFTPEKIKEAFTLNSQVNYIAKGGNFKNLGKSYSGDMAVLANVISNLYLHREIRAKGGAYGAGIRIAKSGNVATYSYRDPHVKETIAAYDGIGDFLRSLKLSERDLADMIIGVMNVFDPHMAPPSYGLMDFKRFLNGTSRTEIESLREEALKTTVADLKGYGDMIDALMGEDQLVAMGSEAALKETAAFDRYESLNR